MGFLSRKRSSSEPDVATLPPPPPIPHGYYEEILTATGFPVTADNLWAVQRMVGTMFLVKAWEFINSQDEAGAVRFRDAHAFGRSVPVEQWPSSILADLVAWNPRVSPYIQDLPSRVRGLIIDGSTPGGNTFMSGDRSVSLKEWWDRSDASP